jgi:hypothetical protein
VQQQTGWRSCRQCQGLISINIGAGTCLDNTMHDFMAGPELRAVTGDVFPDEVQRHWGLCIRCARLVFVVVPGVCWDGAVHEFAEFDAEYGVAFGPAPEGTQPGWRSCGRCQCLSDANNPSHRCFAGGDHDFTGSFEYAVPIVQVGLQGWWQWCSKCQGVTLASGGRCHDGEPHQAGGVDNYNLVFGTTPPGHQEGWRLCTKCNQLCFGGDPGVCWAGGEHDHTGALTYSIAHDAVPDGAQPGWRWCSKCQLLSYTGFSVGPCPAGDLHDQSSSGAYGLMVESLVDGQPGWRRCGKCNAMTFTQLGLGACRDGSAHDVSASALYRVPNVVVPIGAESSWRLCGRCHSLVFGGVESGEVCVDGAEHVVVDSPVYGVHTEFAPEGAEAGWRRCNRCQELAFDDDGTGSGGICFAAGTHDFTGSPAYLVAVHEPAGPAAPVGARLALTESAESIVVDGTGFTPGATVALTFSAVGSAATTASAPVDDQGGFRHTTTDVVPTQVDCLVLAQEEGGRSATGRLRSFAPRS